MPTECSSDVFAFAPVEGRAVVAAFDGAQSPARCCSARPDRAIRR
jgi:hypothetical protein